jgi:hypothetical protein
MEARISNSEACELAGVAITVSATLDGSLDQSMLEQLFVKELSVATQVTNQVANLGTNASIWMLDQHIQISVNVRVMDWLVEVLADTSKLRDKTQAVDNEVD